MTTAVYAGTFDPVTLGHADLIKRSAHTFDRLIVAVSSEPLKETLFSADERFEMIRTLVADMPNVETDRFSGLLIDYVRARNVDILLRGLRAHADFEYEFRMALTNRKLAPELETLFLMPSETHSYVSSSMVKEVASFGGDVSPFVPPGVGEALCAKFGLKP